MVPVSGCRAATRLDLWVGSDDVVQRLDLVTERSETRVVGERRARQPGQPVTVIPPPDPSRTETVPRRSSYSVRFFDLVAPVTIEAPADAVEVETLG